MGRYASDMQIGRETVIRDGSDWEADVELQARRTERRRRRRGAVFSRSSRMHALF